MTSLMFFPSRNICRVVMATRRLSACVPSVKTRTKPNGLIIFKSNFAVALLATSKVSSSCVATNVVCAAAIAAIAAYTYLIPSGDQGEICKILPSMNGVRSMAKPVAVWILDMARASSLLEQTSARAALHITVFENVVRINLSIRQMVTSGRFRGFLKTSKPRTMLQRGPTRNPGFLPIASESFPPAWFTTKLASPTIPEVFPRSRVAAAASLSHKFKKRRGSDWAKMKC
mmetsp:Transcript_105713/g.188024  ORF Transcript_105713/g.188024 Transcript_105713/m.188024 type:complete len:230 (-) Transcript_105713:127-816(-)